MKTELYLQIPKPCHENWDAMTILDKGKFCASCSKEVIDFSVLSDAEVLNFFKKSTGNTCGRFTSDQLQRPIQETRIEKKKGWKWVMASITSLIMISRSYAQKKEDCSAILGKVAPQKTVNQKPPVTLRTMGKPVIKTQQPQTQLTMRITQIIPDGKIKGFVFDETNNPIPGARISIDNNSPRIFTDWHGYFEIPTNTKDDTLSLTFSAFGYIDENPVIDLTKDPALRIIMKPKFNVLPEVTVTSFGTKECIAIAGGIFSYKPVSKKDTAAAFIRKALDTLVPLKILSNPLKIYPNPAVKNSFIHISIKDAGNYQIQLFDHVSRLLQSEENITTIKQQTINFQLPSGMASGNYYIRLINMQTRRSYTDKLIVQ